MGRSFCTSTQIDITKWYILPELLPKSKDKSPEGPPPTAAKVAQAFRQSLRRNTRKHPQRSTSHNEGQGELGGEQHRSNRCEASASRKDHHLHRHEDRPTGSELVHEWQ